MKKCPSCNRTYQDDTLAFCFDDGFRLSAAYDPGTPAGPAARAFDPQRTAILPPKLTPANQASPLTIIEVAEAILQWMNQAANNSTNAA